MRTATPPQVNAKRDEMTGAELEEPRFSVQPGSQRTGPDVCSTVHDAYGQRPGVPGDGNEWFRRSARARPEVIGGLRHEIVAFARRLGADDDLCHNLALAVGEGLNNTAIHAYPEGKTGLVHVEAWHDQHGQLFVRIEDEGVGMLPRPDSPGLGLGLPLMAQMADEVQVADRDEVPGTMVLLRLTLRASSPEVSVDGHRSDAEAAAGRRRQWRGPSTGHDGAPPTTTLPPPDKTTSAKPDSASAAPV